jgi:cation diffusion facilitator family transporter
MAALGSIGSALVLGGLKVFLAVASGGLGIFSEALHSGLDLIAAILTWFSVRVSERPADSEHTYGHGSTESFSAFVETGLLLVTSVYIIVEAFVRLLYKRVHPEASLLVMLTLGLAMGIDLIRSRVRPANIRVKPSKPMEVHPRPWVGQALSDVELSVPYDLVLSVGLVIFS